MTINDAPRIALLLLGIALIPGCHSVTSHLRASQTSEFSVYTYPTCEASSVNFRELNDARGHKVNPQPMPLRVRSGVYAIGLACGTVFDPESSACIVPPQSDPTIDVPTYQLIVAPRVRYEFACRIVNGAWTYTMVESGF